MTHCPALTLLLLRSSLLLHLLLLRSTSTAAAQQHCCCAAALLRTVRWRGQTNKHPNIQTSGNDNKAHSLRDVTQYYFI